MKKILLHSLLVLICGLAQGQTIALLNHDADQAHEGYNLFCPAFQGDVFLMDNCGRLVYTWPDTIYQPGAAVYLTEEGHMYKCISRGPASNEWMDAGGGGEGIEVRNFENEILWQWFYNDSTVRLHHDISIIPNGNILAIAWERKLYDECIQAGRNPELMIEDELWPDHVIEIEPIGTDSANIVWQWHAWDHLVQDFDDEMDNFGVVADHPELIDMNFTPDSLADWHHLNAIDYNPFLDQIILCSPTFNEMWIIDHSTTTEQAAGHSGGLAGKGGDLIYRWGNPQAYDQGTEEDRILGYPHDTHWLDQTLEPGHPDFGKIGFFNNRAAANYSSVGTINPLWDIYEFEYEMIGDVYAPMEEEWEYHRPDSTAMFSPIVSNMQRFENGNTLICCGRSGYTFEITPDEEVVWEYINPMIFGVPIEQGGEIATFENLQFRMFRYGIDFAGFDGIDLEPYGYIELNPDTTVSCPLDSTIYIGERELSEVLVYPNPSNDFVRITTQQDWGQIQNIALYSASGQLLVNRAVNDRLMMEISLQDFPAGMYILDVQSSNGLSVQRVVIRE